MENEYARRSICSTELPVVFKIWKAKVEKMATAADGFFLGFVSHVYRVRAAKQLKRFPSRMKIIEVPNIDRHGHARDLIDKEVHE